jgi:predicted nucleic acid-binding Zn ribbon protein
MLPASHTPDAETRFFKRRRIARAFDLIWILIGLGNVPAFEARWPVLAHWCFWLFALGSFPVCAAYFWAARCIYCGAGIKLNGRTCSKCGHEFSRMGYSSRPT